MKILYAFQGTGNGHISRALELVPLIKKKHSVDVLVSGRNFNLEPDFDIKYQYDGVSFGFNGNGGIGYSETIKDLNLSQFITDVKNLPVKDYDLVINDFEPVSAWACKKKGGKCVSLSHQYAVASRKSPKPFMPDLIGSFILNKYAPCKKGYGFHFDCYSDDIFPPVIRKAIRGANPMVIKGSYVVYLPAYSDDCLVSFLSQVKHVQWIVFSKYSKVSYKKFNVTVKPVGGDFDSYFINCEGVLCGAGFETPAEAMYMGKKLMVIPMRGQYEQKCNAAALEEEAVDVRYKVKIEHILDWIHKPARDKVFYPDISEDIIDIVIADAVNNVY